MRLRANTLSAQIDGSEIGVDGTRQARQIRSICLSNMKNFLKVVNTHTASLPWIRYSAFTDATLLRYYFWSHHIYFSERWLSWKHCIVVFVAFLCEMPWASDSEVLNTICHRMTGTFWKFQMDFSPCANNDDSLSSAGQHFLWNEFQHMSKRGSCYILNGYFECTNGTISLRTWYIVPCS